MRLRWLGRGKLRAGAAAAFATALLCLPLAALVGEGDVRTSPRLLPGGASREGSSTLLRAPQPGAAASLDPAAEAELARLSRLGSTELLTAAGAKSGFSRLLAMNVLWARGEHVAVEQLARASGDRTLVAKARALANRDSGR